MPPTTAEVTQPTLAQVILIPNTVPRTSAGTLLNRLISAGRLMPLTRQYSVANAIAGMVAGAATNSAIATAPVAIAVTAYSSARSRTASDRRPPSMLPRKLPPATSAKGKARSAKPKPCAS